MAEALQDELLAVPGIAGAEVESDHGIAGVRVQLATGADADAVGLAVRRILAHHGMRSAPAGEDQSREGPPPPPGAPGSVVSFPLGGRWTDGVQARPSDAAPGPSDADEPKLALSHGLLIGEHAVSGVGDTAEAAAPRLESVAVEETPDGVSVAVRASDGTRSVRAVEPGLAGMDSAVVAAVAELAGEVDVSLIGLAESVLGDQVVITVLVGLGETRHASGAAVQQGGRAYAIAKAVWVAISLDRASRIDK